MRCGGHAEAFESAPAIGLARCRQTARPRIANVDRLERDTSSNECRRQTRDRTTVTELSEVVVPPAERRPIEREGTRVCRAGGNAHEAEIAVDRCGLEDDPRVGTNAKLSDAVHTPAIGDSILRDGAVMRSARAYLRPNQVAAEFRRRLCRIRLPRGVDERVRAPAVDGVVRTDAAIVCRDAGHSARRERLELDGTRRERRREFARRIAVT